MTQKDYSVIKRQLGFIEGMVANVESNIVCDGVIGAIETIEEIVDKEMVGKQK